MQVGARAWAKHDQVRQRLAECYDGMQREERIRVMRNQWRAEVAARKTSTGSAAGVSGHDRRGQSRRGKDKKGGEVGC
ncbi:hypothetical protein MYCTH_2309226 [Thermothelomyces thermophilus ATCC 42464]|uniref:Uncharacterized protein n=1 Tax=Thermothelomyces thermophilus (strain ATCC 42464 / BCRC 31852 / DSM 1799) TaxID=573729 RepID=G2QI31_THET4|nr:uncharacterized protein MYCTH_2309226 [Thermothelomyces thermophilus ATCC 42464]AEO60220.1 hypothetical protein MYCTH_2309226 [Thermothelomyces thermophilus ATCC 42464]